MNLNNNTVLITGGATGIGYGLTEMFLNAGSKVIICGRRQTALAKAKELRPELITRVCDVANVTERIELAKWACSEFSNLNVLVNNAGIQNRMPINISDFWERSQKEITINFEAPLHLSHLFLEHLSEVKNAAIMNVSSGLAFVPMTISPVYCATKAGLHSFTQSLRHQTTKLGIKVFEIIPPAVDTELGGAGIHISGVSVQEFTASVKEQLIADNEEIAYGFASNTNKASREELDVIFKRMNR